jgi:hypothetical protein
MAKLLKLAIVAIGLTWASGAWASSTVCGETDLLVRLLHGQDQERQRSMGMTARGELLELYVARDGSWTILMTGLDGGACIVKDGDAGEAIPDTRTTLAELTGRPLVLQR